MIFWTLLFWCFTSVVQVSSLNEALMGHSVLYGISALAQNSSNSSLCHEHLVSLFQAAESGHVWALKAVDASGSPGPGFLYGNNLWLGSHSQCSDIGNKRPMEINHKKVAHPEPTPYDYPPYPMGFTMVHMRHDSILQHHTRVPLEFTIQLGLCLPASCQSENLTSLITEYLDDRYLHFQDLYKLNLTVTEIKNLESGGSWMLKLPKTIILICLTVAVISLSIIGTIYDVKKHNREKREKNLIVGHNVSLADDKLAGITVCEVELVSKSSSLESLRPSTLCEIVKCFSIYSNVKNLVNVELSTDSIPEIHGLKFFGMLWVVLLHGIFYQADYINNVPTAFRLSEAIFSQILSNSTYAVDTYLFLSGFLVAFSFYKSRKSEEPGGPVNYKSKVAEFFRMIINRFLRLTPPYAVLILFSDVMHTYYRKTSSLTSSEAPDMVCPKYWWRNLLYINNLYPRSEMCLSWSWYLSIDTQFFVVAAFLLLLSTVFFKTSAFIVVLLIILNIIVTTYKSYSIGYIPTLDEQLAQLDALYDLPWNRIGPYLIGVITAYILLVKLKRKLELKEGLRIFLWTIFPLLNLWILFTLYTRQLSVGFSAIYMGISRTLWGVGLAWLIIACCTGNARALQKFLSFKGWIPLSRLTYCAYLVNPLIASMLYLGSETAYNASLPSFSLNTQGVTLDTFYVAFIFSMLFESPFLLLTKMMLNMVTRRSRK